MTFHSRTDRAARLDELADAEAEKRGHTYVGTEHLLFALLAGEGVARTILNDLGVDYEAADAKFTELMNRNRAVEPR